MHIFEAWPPLEAQKVNNLPVMEETCVQSLGQEDTLEKEMAAYSTVFAWEIRTWRTAVCGFSKELNTTEQLTLPLSLLAL